MKSLTLKSLSCLSKASHPCLQFRTLGLIRVATGHRLNLQNLLSMPRGIVRSRMINAPRISTRAAARETSRIRPFSGGSSARALTQNKWRSWSTSFRLTIAGVHAAYKAWPSGSALVTLKSTNGSTIDEKEKEDKDHEVKTAHVNKACKTRGKSDVSEPTKTSMT